MPQRRTGVRPSCAGRKVNGCTGEGGVGGGLGLLTGPWLNTSYALTTLHHQHASISYVEILVAFETRV